MSWKKLLLIVLGIILIIFGLNEPMILIFPMWIFTYLSKERLTNLLEKLPLWLSFIGTGILFGLLTEIFAIIENLSKPIDQRILLSGDPLTDIIYGFVYYLFVVLAWYLLLRKMRYSNKDVFFNRNIWHIYRRNRKSFFEDIHLSWVWNTVCSYYYVCLWYLPNA